MIHRSIFNWDSFDNEVSKKNHENATENLHSTSYLRSVRIYNSAERIWYWVILVGDDEWKRKLNVFISNL